MMSDTAQGIIHGINGPVIKVHGEHPFKMLEMVLVGNERLIGEVIRVLEDETIVQVYENTTGLKPGEPVYSTGRPLTIKLGPGILGNIFDGIERPLVRIADQTGPFIGRGTVLDNLDNEKLWDTVIRSCPATMSPRAQSLQRLRRPAPSCIRSWFLQVWRVRSQKPARTVGIPSPKPS
jgi:V/A-type H+-transporting ATPase subunit A